nr:hypothetical protein [Tanacetum cinerariifolium]
MSRDVITVGSTMRIPLLYRGEYSQWRERFMNYLEEQTNGEAMINSIQNGDQPLLVNAQVSLAGTAQNAPPTLKDPKFWTAEEKKTRKIDRLARSLLIQGLPNDIYALIDSNETAKDLWDALERQMRGSEYAEQDGKATILYEYETFKAIEGEQLLDTYLRYLQVINNLKKYGYKKDNCELNYKFLNNLQQEWKQYTTLMRQTKNLIDINIDALYNILKQNQGDVNDTLGYKKKAVVVHSDPLALVAEKTNVSKRKEKVVVSSDSERSGSDDFSELKKITALLAKAFNRRKFYSKLTNNNFRTSSTSQSANKKQEFVKSDDKKEDKKADEKKRDMSKTKMLLAKKDSDEQVLLAEDQTWMESSSDFDQEINANMVFMAQIKKKRIEKANQQSKEFKNQNNDLQEKYDVLINQVNTFKEKYNEFNAQIKLLNEKNADLLAQTKVLKDQLQVKHVVIDTHVECHEKYAKLEKERYEYMIRYSALFDNDKQHRKQIADQEVLFDKMSVQLVKLDKHVRDLKNTILEKDFKIYELEECVCNKDLEIEKCLERLNVYENKIHKMGQTNQTVHMIMPSKDILYNGQKEIGFENPRYFEKAKDLRPSLYDEKVIGLGYTLMFLTHSDEALEIKKFKKSRENKIEFAYDYGNLNASYANEKINFEDDYFQEIINPDFEKIDSLFQQTSSLKPYVSNVILEKIIIDLEDEAVSLLEKEKENLKTIEPLKSEGFELSENAISESENQSENDCYVVENECDKVENPKNVESKLKRKRRKRKSSKQNVKQVNNDVSRANSDFVYFSDLDTFSSVRRPKHSSVIWKKKRSSNTSNVDLSVVSHSNLNKNVKRYSHKDLLACNNSHLGETCSAYVCNDTKNVSCNPRMCDLLDDNNFFIFDDESVRISLVSKMPFRKKPYDSMNVRSKNCSDLSLDNRFRMFKAYDGFTSFEASKKDLEDLFQKFYDEYFDFSKIMKSLTTNVETSVNEEVFHESISNNMIPNDFEASTSHNVFNEHLRDAYFNASTSFHDPSNVHTFYQPYPHGKKWTKDHPLHKIISDPKSCVRTRGQLANSCLFSCLLSFIEPANVAEALRDADWVSAMQEELDQFARLKVWILVPRPEGKFIIKTKLIFKNKKDESSLVIRNKVRLVAVGYSQQEGIDYD